MVILWWCLVLWLPQRWHLLLCAVWDRIHCFAPDAQTCRWVFLSPLVCRSGPLSLHTFQRSENWSTGKLYGKPFIVKKKLVSCRLFSWSQFIEIMKPYRKSKLKNPRRLFRQKLSVFLCGKSCWIDSSHSLCFSLSKDYPLVMTNIAMV